MPQNLDFIDLFNDGKHTYSLKRDEPWKTTQAYIYVDRSAEFRLTPEPVLCVETGTLSSAEKQSLEAHLSPSRDSTASKTIFERIFEQADIHLWIIGKEEDERLRYPGTWGIPNELTLCNAGTALEHQDLTRAGSEMRKHRVEAKRIFGGEVKVVTGNLPSSKLYYPSSQSPDSEPMVHYLITGEDRWAGSALPDLENPFSHKNHPIFNQDGQRYIDEIVHNRRTYWSKLPLGNQGEHVKFEVIGWIYEDDPKAAKEATQQGKASVRIVGKGARWSEDGLHLIGFLEATEILVDDVTGKPFGGIQDTNKDKITSSPTIYRDLLTNDFTPLGCKC